jgi:hypothetical protein
MSLATIETRKFSTHSVLCVATKTIPDSKLLPNVYRLLELLTGGPVSTAQFTAAMHESQRFLVYRNPLLVAGWPGASADPAAISTWFAEKIKAEGARIPVTRN